MSGLGGIDLWPNYEKFVNTTFTGLESVTALNLSDMYLQTRCSWLILAALKLFRRSLLGRPYVLVVASSSFKLIV